MMPGTKKLTVTSLLSFVVLTFLLAGVISMGTGCAGMTPPTGGPRDSLPPQIVNITPKDSTINFDGKKIELQFNEFVQLQDVQQNLLVSPVPKVNPTLEARLRSITVTIRDTLEENTTYSIDFGNSIRDYTESNPLRGYRYIFSTGSTIDSLELAGSVIIAETGKPDSTLIVMLHTSFDDSAIVKDRPRYIARLDSTGHFRFQNLAKGTYAIYAMKDEGGSRRYLSKDQLFAFYDSAVAAESQKKDIQLYAFVAEDTASSRSGLSPLAAPARGRRGNRDEEDNFLRMETNIGESKDLLTPLELSFSAPVEVFDSSRVVLTDTAFQPVSNYHFARDTSGKKVSLVYPWAENTYYTLVVDTTAAIDTAGRRLAAPDTITFVTKKKSQYGLVRLRFMNLPLARKPILQLVQGDIVKHTHIFTDNQFYAPLFTPGDYEMRLVFDDNRNGKWDPGNFFGKKRQPEKVQVISRKLSVKPNWDSEIDIQL
jgi:hypothetical protein